MPQTKQRRRTASPSAIRRPVVARPRRAGAPKPSRFSRRKAQPTGVKRVLGALTSSKAGKGGVAAGGLALLAGGLSALRKRRSGDDDEASHQGAATYTQTPTAPPSPIVPPPTQDGA
jgi:hypothetical protein